MSVKAIMQQFTRGEVNADELKTKLGAYLNIDVTTAPSKKYLLFYVDKYFLGKDYKKLLEAIREFKK